LARNGAGDRTWARAQLDEAVAGYRALGMDGWAAAAAASRKAGRLPGRLPLTGASVYRVGAGFPLDEPHTGGSKSEEGSMSRKTLKTTATLAAVLATAVVAPAAASANTDLRSPDAVDASRAVVVSSGQDLRSPDARDASRPVVVTTGQDLRSPDARDARFVPESNPQDLRSPDATDVSRPSTSPVQTAAPDNGGTDWGQIGMITGAVVLALTGIGALFYVSRRRGSIHKSGATPAHS